MLDFGKNHKIVIELLFPEVQEEWKPNALFPCLITADMWHFITQSVQISIDIFLFSRYWLHSFTGMVKEEFRYRKMPWRKFNSTMLDSQSCGRKTFISIQYWFTLSRYTSKDISKYSRSNSECIWKCLAWPWILYSFWIWKKAIKRMSKKATLFSWFLQ